MIGLFPNCGFLSETSRMLAIHDALRALGEPVCIASHGGPYSRLLCAAGVEWTPLAPRTDDARCARLLRDIPGIGSPRQSLYSDEEMISHAQAEAAFMRARGVRLCVSGFTLTTLLSTRIAGIPLATSHAGSYVPPVFEAGLMPAPSRPPMPLFGLLPAAWRRRFMNWAPAHTGLYCAGFNRAARTLGVEGVPSFAALLLGDLTLVTDVPEILGVSAPVLHSWSPAGRRGFRPGTTLRYTGPLYSRMNLPLPARVDEFLNGSDPVIYVALTSTTESLLREVVAAVAEAGARVLVAATVHDLSDLDGGRVMVEPLLPSHLVMPRVAVAVTAGGQGSVQTAVASGVPLAAVPLQPEQDLNVHLVQRQGMAVSVAPRHAGGPEMTRAVRRLLTDASFRAQARRLQAVLAPIDGAMGAAHEIRRYLAGRRSGP